MTFPITLRRPVPLKDKLETVYSYSSVTIEYSTMSTKINPRKSYGINARIMTLHTSVTQPSACAIEIILLRCLRTQYNFHSYEWNRVFENNLFFLLKH